MRNTDEKQQTVLAICYDFDKTLSPTDMQAQGFIQSIDCEVADSIAFSVVSVTGVFNSNCLII